MVNKASVSWRIYEGENIGSDREKGGDAKQTGYIPHYAEHYNINYSVH